jgi:predicted branched-subunit amino acid permease
MQKPSNPAIVRDALGIGVGVAAYGVGFGALGISAGLSFWQTMILSLVMFTGASQFAPAAAIAAAWLLGFRNLPYAISMANLVRPTRRLRPLAAQLTIDESTAMALAHQSDTDSNSAKQAFWLTGISVYVFWNIATALGAVAAASTSDPAAFGLDAAISAGFVALLWPQLKDALRFRVAIAAGIISLLLIPIAPAGIPILVAGFVAGFVGVFYRLQGQ